MQIFEFLFNPNSPDAVYDTFCFKPENEKEKRLGNLYIAGEIKNSLPQKRHFLFSLANIIKQGYYKDCNASPEENFKKSLEKANEFLSSQIKNNEVDWLGNLNFVVLTINSSYSLNLTKVGNFRIFILKNGEILNIGQNTNLQQQAGTSKIFQNIITGSLDSEDKILITTKEIADLFEKEKILEHLAKVKEKEIKKIFKTKRKLFESLFGFCLLISLKSKKRKILRISFSKIRFPFLKRLIPELSKERFKKSLISILILTILLFLGSLLFR